MRRNESVFFLNVAFQVRNIQNSGFVGLAAAGKKLGRNGRLSLLQVEIIIVQLFDKLLLSVHCRQKLSLALLLLQFGTDC